jgi:hypothetical protein
MLELIAFSILHINSKSGGINKTMVNVDVHTYNQKSWYVSANIKNTEKPQINDLMLHVKLLLKKQAKPKTSRKKWHRWGLKSTK